MRIHYIISHGVAEWVETDSGDTDTLVLIFEPRYNGALVDNGTVYPINNGEVSIPRLALCDGTHRPRLECECGVIEVSPFTKSRREIAPSENGGENVRRLIKSCYETEKRLKKAEATILRLEKMCEGHNIFNYERNKK